MRTIGLRSWIVLALVCQSVWAQEGSRREPPASPSPKASVPRLAPGRVASDKEAKSRYVRLVRDDRRRPVSLDTSIVSLASNDPARQDLAVDLVAAIHLGEKEYYDQLNRQFATYDVVLYELVAPEGTRVPQGGAKESGNPISLIQRTLTDVLRLRFQLDAIDYTQPNFVHADLSPKQLQEAMQKRGENMWTMLLRMMGYAMSQQGAKGDGDVNTRLLMAFFDKNQALALKQVMAEQFQDMDGTLAAIDGPKGSALVTDRNSAAIEVLKKQIAAGKRKIAIFYGGAHMPDFEKRLAELGLKPSRVHWLTAWNLKSP